MAITFRQWLHKITAPRRTKFGYAADTPESEVIRLTYLESVRAIVDDANARIAVVVGTDYHSARIFYILMQSVERLEQLIKGESNHVNTIGTSASTE